MAELSHTFPDAYQLAAFLGKRFGAAAILDIGCAAPDSLMSITDLRKIGLADKGALTQLKANSSLDDWRMADFTSTDDWPIDPSLASQAIVICAGTLENAIDPELVMRKLANLSRAAVAMVLVADPRGASAEFAAQAQTVQDFKNFIGKFSVEPAFVGRTVPDRNHPKKSALLALIDRFQGEPHVIPRSFRPIALLQTYNDIDIAPQTIQKLLDDNIEVHARDNWSTDGTFEILLEMATCNSSLTVCRVPAQGATQYHDLIKMLRWKEEVAAQHPGRWIITHDSDEIRWSPWANVSLRGGIYIADRSGFNAVDFTVLNFRPCDDRFGPGKDPANAFPYFEFGRLTGHFIQMKAWRQPSEGLMLAASGGHDAAFAGRRPFPYKFLLKHYPLRSHDQARRKIFRERRPRYHPETLAKGWHIQYDQFKESDRFLWDPHNLIAFDETATREEYLVELISGIGIVR